MQHLLLKNMQSIPTLRSRKCQRLIAFNQRPIQFKHLASSNFPNSLTVLNPCANYQKIYDLKKDRQHLAFCNGTLSPCDCYLHFFQKTAAFVRFFDSLDVTGSDFFFTRKGHCFRFRLLSRDGSSEIHLLGLLCLKILIRESSYNCHFHVKIIFKLCYLDLKC